MDARSGAGGRPGRHAGAAGGVPAGAPADAAGPAGMTPPAAPMTPAGGSAAGMTTPPAAPPRRWWRGSAQPGPQSPWDRRILAGGLVLLCCLIVYALIITRGSLETDLSERAAARLEEAGESWAVARFDGRDATLQGEALAQEPRDKVRRAIETLPGVRSVRDATTLLPERRPFTFSVVRDGNTLQMEGYVPSHYALMRITAAVNGLPPGLSVRGLDRLVRARGAPPGDFAAVVAFALEMLSRLPSGRVTLSDDAFAIEGRAPDLATYEALAQRLHAPLPQGVRLVRFAVRPPVAVPFTWAAVRDGDAVRLEGYVPSDAARGEVLTALHAVLPDAGVADATVLGDGAPATDLWLKAVRYAAAQLALLPHGRVAFSDTAITLEGAAGSFPVFDALVAARRAPPDGFQVVRFAIEPPPVSPFVWRIWRRGPQVQLTGFAPSEEARRVMSDAVKSLFQGAQVSDQVRLASGGPASEAWIAAVTFTLAQINRLGSGEASIVGTVVTVSGEAADSAAFTTLQQAVKAPPPGVAVDAAKVLPPVISPYVFAARSDEAGVTLSGFFPDAMTHERVRAQVARLFPGARLNDVSAVGGGAPAGFLPALDVALLQLARLESGDLRISDGQILLSGIGAHGAVGAEIRAQLAAALPPSMTGEVSVEPAPVGVPVGPAECLRLLGDALGRGLSFDAQGQLTPDSAPALDRLAAAVQRCPALVLSPAAAPPVEMLAAEARGRAVMAGLLAAGVPAPHVQWLSALPPQLGAAAVAEGLALRVREPG